MQGFDATVEHLGETGVRGDFYHGQPRVGEQFGRAAGREQFHAVRVQGLREFEHAGFVRDGQQCCFDHDFLVDLKKIKIVRVIALA